VTTRLPVVLIAEELAPRVLEVLGEDVEVRHVDGADRSALLPALADAAAVMIRSATRIDAEALAAAPNLKVVARAGIGLDNVDVPAATERGVMVVNAPTSNIVSAAEHAVALLLAAARQIPAADASLREGAWQRSKFMGVEVTDKTVGVVGLGRIGVLVAQRLAAFGVTLIAYDPYIQPGRAGQLGVRLVSLEELLRESDFITIHLPKTPETIGLIGAEELSITKRGVIIVNAARGGLVDEAALRAALDSGHVAGAAFDVFTEEPAVQNPLFGHPDVVCTPHLGAATMEAQENVALQVAEQMSDYLLRGAITNAVNFPSITAEEAPKLRPFIDLAEKLGSFAGQLTETGINKVHLTYEGAVAQMKTKALTSAAVAGLLRPMLQDVNVVSAPIVAKERGIIVEETTREAQGDHDSLITLAVTTERQGLCGRAPAHHQHQGHPHGGGIRSLDALCREPGQAGLRRPLRQPAGRCRHQHRHISPRPAVTGRRRHCAGRGRWRRAGRYPQEGRAAPACESGEAAAVLRYWLRIRPKSAVRTAGNHAARRSLPHRTASFIPNGGLRFGRARRGASFEGSRAARVRVPDGECGCGRLPVGRRGEG
jgi:D-3-phosphoglycerate dehydrogenase